MISLRVSVLVAALAMVVSGCGGGAPAPAPKKVRSTPPKAAKAQPVAAAKQPAPEEPPFVYNPEGLRDPFVPFIKLEPRKKEQKKPEVFVPKTPLQRYALEELKLAGIVWAGKERSRALIEDPEGKGYVVTVGTLVGDRGGKIVGVHPDRVVVEERFLDVLGEETVNKVVLSLRKPEDEVRP